MKGEGEPTGAPGSAPWELSRPAAGRGRRVPRWVWLAIPAALLALVALVIGLVALFPLTATESEPDGEERALLLTAADLRPLVDGLEVDPALESFRKLTYFDGSFELEYEYDSGDPDWPLYLHYSVHYENSAVEASLVYNSIWAGARIGMVFDLSVEERNDLYAWGQSSRFAILSQEGEPVGNMLAARQGNYILFMILTGVHLETGAELDALLAPRLELLEALARGS